MSSALKFRPPVQGDGAPAGAGLDWAHVYQFYGDAAGLANWARQHNYTGFTHDTEYGTRNRNRGSGGLHERWEKSTDGSTIATMTDAGLGVTTLAVSGDLTVGDDLAVTDDATIGGTLAVTDTTTLGVLNAGATSVTTLAASGAAELNGAVTLGDAAGDTITVNGTPTFNAAATFVGNLTVNGDAALGNANTDTLTVIGVSTYRNAANTQTQLKVDAGNNRVIVGSSTALASDTTPALHVVGRAYIAPDSANDLALELRRSTAATPAMRLGVSSNGELVLKDETDTTILLAGGATYAVDITGDARVSDDFFAGARAVIGGTSFSGTEELRVVGEILAAAITFNGSSAPLTLIGSNQLQSVVGAAGTASALPAKPSWYMKVVISGVEFVAPLYLAS